jgi:hypothetical protein
MVEVLSTMCHFYLPRSNVLPKPDCVPGQAHYWQLETAQTAANDGRLGTSDGVCINCEARYTFFNSIIDYDAKAHRQINLGNTIGKS